MLNIQQLHDGGAFVPDAPVKKHIEWKIGKKAFEGDVFVRQFGIEEWQRYFIGEGAGKRIIATLLSAAIRLGDDGKEELTVDQAASLHPNLAMAMMKAAQEVHDPKDPSPTEIGS